MQGGPSRIRARPSKRPDDRGATDRRGERDKGILMCFSDKVACPKLSKFIVFESVVIAVDFLLTFSFSQVSRPAQKGKSARTWHAQIATKVAPQRPRLRSRICPSQFDGCVAACVAFLLREPFAFGLKTKIGSSKLNGTSMSPTIATSFVVESRMAKPSSVSSLG